MRKSQQEKIVVLLQTLREAHDELRKCREPAVIQSLLADCQEFALQIGQYIEDIEGAETKTVSLLEEYCEFVYKASLDFEVKSHTKGLASRLFAIENAVRTELRPNKIEIVFFPYQAAMWDSLESVYLAAEDDPDCDAFCVPIPWFERLPDGSLGKMHYDGDQYPANIHVTDWRDYDVEARCPDVVFIHSPYDNGNLVTSVHPEFYSERLREHTGLLCYIPYFVCADDVEEIFCTTAGCIYAHKTILESEKVRDTYIRVFQKAFGNRFGNPKDKFIALGSPKYDKVLTTRWEDCALPEIWNNLIAKDDGSKKKAVLYNTSIAGILRCQEQYLEKMRSVLAAFKNRDDVLLWWRPHPLSEQTYASMRPALAEEYRRIVAEYKRDGYGIFDDTPDLHRAIAWSDVYYGDGGSVLKLYKATKKTNIIPNIKYPELDTINYFQVAHADYNGKRYSLVSGRNIIIETDLQTLASRYYGSIPGKEYSTSPHPYHRMYTYNDNLVFVPFDDTDLVIHNFTTCDWEIIELDLKKALMGEKGNFYHALFANDELYLLPFGYKGIVSYNFTTGEVRQRCSFSSRFDDIMPGISAHCFINTYAVLLTSVYTGYIFEYNFDLDTLEEHKLGSGLHCYDMIINLDGEKYLLVGKNNAEFAFWNIRTKQYRIASEIKFPNGFTGEYKPHSLKTVFARAKEPLILDDWLYCFPTEANMAIRLHLKKFVTERIVALDNYCARTKEMGDTSLFSGLELTNAVFYATWKNEFFLMYRPKTEEVVHIPIRPNWNDAETEMLNNRFLSALLGGERPAQNDCGSVPKNDGLAGKRIYDYAKKQLNNR